MNKGKIIAELKSMLTTFISEFTLEAGVFLVALYNGDFSKAVLVAIASSAFRSFVKTILKYMFPGFFNPSNLSKFK